MNQYYFLTGKMDTHIEVAAAYCIIIIGGYKQRISHINTASIDWDYPCVRYFLVVHLVWAAVLVTRRQRLSPVCEAGFHLLILQHLFSWTGSGLALFGTRFSTSATDVGFVVYKMALRHFPVTDLDLHWQLSFCLCSVFIYNHCWFVW
jgi:hypothetical protein